ncbi:MAG TPA: DUF2207 domain-containing protein [Vicinamibacterales bacterium]|nr:DUF2207 domain-containing protein [Vicinamibacterales bacterium]
MRAVFAAVFVLLIAASASAKTYIAERFDARVDVLAGGSLRIVETIVFRFEGGTFTRVSRTIPTRRTDGVEFVSASMDGVTLPPGAGAGQVRLRRENGLRVEWRFAPTGSSTHTFVLTYIAKGVARRTADGDVVGWRVMPSEHPYRIEESTIEMRLPSQPLAPPIIETRRVGRYDVKADGTRIVVEAAAIGKNGWLEVWCRVQAGQIITETPAWQRRQEEHRRYRNPSLIAAGIILFAGVVLLFALRQSYDAPPRDMQVSRVFHSPPDALAPALAGALGTNGTPQREHAMATVFSLAARGVVTVREEERRGRFTRRHFTIGRGGARPVAAHEEAILDAIFGAESTADGRVDLNKAHRAIGRHFPTFKDAVLSELGQSGLLDAERRRVRHRFFVLGSLLVALSFVVLAPIVVVIGTYGPWTAVIPATIALMALIIFIVASAHTPLSNEGVRRAEHWRAYQRQLRDMAKDGMSRENGAMGTRSPADLLPFAVALGLATAWAGLFKKRGMPLPAWFQAASTSDAHPAFIAFVGSGSASGHAGGGGAAGGGAAGGGSSSAS